VHDAGEFPDEVDFLTPSVVDSGDVLGVPDVGEDGLDASHSITVAFFGFCCVDFITHGLTEWIGCFNANTKSSVFPFFSETFLFEFTGGARGSCYLVFLVNPSCVFAGFLNEF